MAQDSTVHVTDQKSFGGRVMVGRGGGSYFSDQFSALVDNAS